MPTPLPPTQRDFEIHRLALIELVSTRRLAEKYEISQTRVRQIIHEVSTWLAQMLPIATEADIEREKRLAIHLAAAQLQHQIEQLQIFWQQTSDPKYLRQQTRAILALARLGVTPGAIDALAADRRIGVPPVQANGEAPAAELVDEPIPNPKSPPLPLSPSPPLSPDPCPLTTAPCPPPPLRDCSPQAASPPASPPEAADADRETPSSASTWGDDPDVVASQSEGLTLMENRLLTLLESTDETNHDRRQSLEGTLNKVRQEKAALVLKLAPDQPVLVQTPPALRSPSPTHSAI